MSYPSLTAIATVQKCLLMSDLNRTLQQLVAQTCQHPPRSLERRLLLTEIYQRVMQSGKLWREQTPDYNDALQEMWEFCCQNLEQYDPQEKEVITWLDDHLKKRLRNLRDRRTRQRQREVTTYPTATGDLPDLISTLLARPDIQPVLEVWEKTLHWVETDPEGTLCTTCFRNRSEIHCQALILRRLPPEQSWSEIATEFRLTAAEAKDLPKVYHRKCLCLLRQFAIAQGYIEAPPPKNRHD